MKYVEVPPIEKDQAERIFQSDSPQDVVHALLSAAMHSPDWQWVQDRCLRFLASPNSDVQKTAITCLGHLVRIHARIDRAKVLPALMELSRSNPQLSGRVEDALDDIEMFAPETVDALES